MSPSPDNVVGFTTSHCARFDVKAIGGSNLRSLLLLSLQKTKKIKLKIWKYRSIEGRLIVKNTSGQVRQRRSGQRRKKAFFPSNFCCPFAFCSLFLIWESQVQCKCWDRTQRRPFPRAAAATERARSPSTARS